MCMFLSPTPKLLSLEWRIDPRKVDQELVMQSRREIASTIGKCLYRYFTSGKPLVVLPEAISLIRVLRSIAARNTSHNVRWDERVILDDADKAVLQSEWSTRQNNDWMCFDDEKNVSDARSYILATDASLTHHGHVILDMTGSIVSESCTPFGHDMAKLHIFLLELHAALEGQRACDRLGPLKIFHLIDNNATRHALTRGYSSNDLANRWMRTHFISTPHSVQYLGVVSAENIADNPSRNLKADAGMCDRTRDIVMEAIRGVRLGEGSSLDRRPENEEPVDGAIIYDDLADDDCSRLA